MILPHTCNVQTRTKTSTGSDGRPIYTWANEATGANCRFYSPSRNYSPSRKLTIIESGEVVNGPVKCMVGPLVILTPVTRRIVTTQTGYSGTWNITSVTPRCTMNGNIHHYEATLEEA